MSILATSGNVGRSAGLAAVALAALAAGARPASAEEWTKTYTVSGRAHVRVDTNDGAVRITTGDSKQIELRVVYSGYTVDKNLTINSKQDGDQVELSARVRNNWGWSIGIN